MMLDPRLAQELKDMQQTMRSDGHLPSPQQLQQHYDTFRERFDPERLASLDGEALLNYMHNQGSRDSLAYWLEFKNDDEFPAIFGSISGGSALKFGVYKSAQTGAWMTRDERNYPVETSLENAVDIARTQRAQLVHGVELLGALPSNGTDDDYRALQTQMDAQAPDISRLAWGHKYFSLIFPDKLDDYHNEYFQRFFLMKLLQLPPEGDGRYLCAGRYVAIAHELDMPLNHLTTVLNQRIGKPYKYWRIGTSLGEGRQDIWPACRSGGFIAIGWSKMGDLAAVYADTPEDYEAYVEHLLTEQYPSTQSVITRKAREIRRFVNVTNYALWPTVGDCVLAANGATVLGIGRLAGEYQYVPGSDFPHRRAVEWLSLDEWKLPDTQGLRTTVYEITHHTNLIEAEHLLFEASLRPSQLPGAVQVRPAALSGVPARIQTILERKGQIILYGPPGTGKTYWAHIAARELASISAYSSRYDDLADDQQSHIDGHYVRLCTFHPNYGYEDFLEGYRPELINDQLTFERRDGIFKELCEAARQEPQHYFFLIIDEINRGDIPRIFGELLTVLEKDKRGLSILLPLSNTSFTVPQNVFIVGTMNTADRSIALLDTALRRRFGFLELMPDYDLLKETAVDGIPLALWLEALNRRIVEHVGRDARNLQIGHAYLLENGKPVSSFPRFARIVHEDIIPLLEEYCYEDYGTLARILGNSLVDAQKQMVDHSLFTPAKQDGLVLALLAPSPEITTSREAAIAEQEAEREEDEDEADEDAAER